MINEDRVRRVIKRNIKDADLGLFFTLNNSGDKMTTLYEKDGVRVDICRDFRYYEVFGLDPDEQIRIEKYYERLVNEKKRVL